MIFKPDFLKLYAITDRAWIYRKPLDQQVEDAIRGGATIIQLREKNISEDEFIKEAVLIKKVCSKYDIPLIINDNADVAFKSGADGVHVGINDCPAEVIRQKYGKNFIIGATAKTVEQAKSAQKQGADYIGVGAVFPSPTKTDAVRITFSQLNDICNSVTIPAVAIGGISLENIHELTGCSIKGVAVVSAVFGSEDIQSATVKLRKEVEKYL
ncbi:MAG: thiamine phosphate synthase [Ruminococcus sp.]|nr:thiamine phosphate synthase [Ruminococcus sp.]